MSGFTRRWRAILTSAVRFVDRDMFMRYRGGGVGHKYMREVEGKYENMSRERLHGKQRPKPPRADNANADSENDSGDEPEGTTQPGASQAGQVDKPEDRGIGGDGDERGSDNEDDIPPETCLSDDDDSEEEVVDPDEMDSDGGYDSYGLADV